MIMVSSLNPSTTDECIEFFFENPWRSGGGPVKKMERLEETKALVHFENQQDAKSVMTKAELKLEGSILHVSTPDCGHHHPVENSVSEETVYSAVPNSSDTFTLDNESTFFQNAVQDEKRGAAKNTEDEMADSMLNNEVFLRKKVIPDLNPCQLKVLNNQRVLSQFYRVFPGAEICVETNTQTAHIRASDDIIKQAFTLVHSMISTVQEVRLPLSPALLKMHEKEDHVEWVQKTMIDRLNLICHWELCDQNLVICAQNSSLLLLEQLFRSVFIEIKVHLEEWEVSLLTYSVWTSFLEMLQRDRGECPTPVLLLENDSVIIVDTPSNVSRTQLALRQFLDKHRHQVIFPVSGDGDICQEKRLAAPQIQTDIIPNLKAGQLNVLSCSAALEPLYKENPGLQVCVDKEKRIAVVKAPDHIMKKVFTDVMYFVTLIREVKFPLSPALFKMYEKYDSREWVQKILTDKNEQKCYWELRDQHIIISGQSSDILHLEQTFKAIFKEITIHLKEWEVRVLTAPLWMSFVERLQRDKGEIPEPVLLLERDRVIIVDIPENVDKTQMVLRKFLDEHNIKTTFLPVVDENSHHQEQCASFRVLEDSIPYLKPGQLGILNIPKALEKLYKHYPGLMVHTDWDRKTATVRAPENIMQKAFSDVLCYVTLVKEVRIPLSPALIQMFEKDNNREWIQQTLIDRYELVCHWDLCSQHLVISAPSTKLQRLEQMFKSAFKNVKVYLDKMEAAILTPSVWTSFVEKLQSNREEKPTPVLLLENDCVIIVDIPSELSSTQLALKHFLNEHRTASSSQSDITCVHPQFSTAHVQQNTIPGLKPGQLKVLSCPKALARLYKEYPGVELSVDKDQMAAVVRAPENIMEKAITDVMSSVMDVKELKVALSPVLVQMFEKEDSQEWIQKTLIDKYELACHWELYNRQLIISAQSANLFRLEHLFKSVFREMKISLKDRESGILTPLLWSSYVNEQERDRRGKPKPILLLDGDSVTIVDIASKVDETHLALIQLLNDIST